MTGTVTGTATGAATRALALAAVLLAGTEAAALSCERPDPVRTFQRLEAAPEAYVVLHGRLSFDEGRLPAEAPRGAAPGTTEMPRVPARFEGFALTTDGFAQALAADLALRPVCAGPYCGSIREGTWVLFAEPTPDGYAVTLGPCGGRAFEPDPAMLDALAACMGGEACGAADPP